MEKWGSKWLEMHSQRHRFFKKKIRGRSPVPPRISGGFNPTLILSPAHGCFCQATALMLRLSLANSIAIATSKLGWYCKHVRYHTSTSVNNVDKTN